MGVPNYVSQQLDVCTNQSMGADFFSSSMDVTGFSTLCIQAVWTGANRTTAKVVPQASINNTTWCNLVPLASSKVVGSPADCLMYDFASVSPPYVRISFVANTNTTGTITVTFFAKRLIA